MQALVRASDPREQDADIKMDMNKYNILRITTSWNHGVHVFRILEMIVVWIQSRQETRSFNHTVGVTHKKNIQYSQNIQPCECKGPKKQLSYCI